MFSMHDLCPPEEFGEDAKQQRYLYHLSNIR
jgi:hypothetical protein